MRLRAGLIALAAAALGLACLVLRPEPTGGPALRDFESSVGGGAAWSAGLDPYGTAVWPFERTVPGVVGTRDELLPFVGPPFGLFAWAMLARLPYAVACALWTAVLIAALATLVLGALRLGRRPVDALDVLAAAALCGGFGPTISAVALGQVALTASGAIVGALLALEGTGRRTWRLIAAAVAATCAALQPNLAVVLAARIRDRGSAFALGGAAFAAYGLSALALHDPAWPLRYAALLASHGAAEHGIAIQTTPAGVALGFGASNAAASALAALIALGVAALLARQLASGRYEPVAGVALACAALPLALPFAHEHDFALVLFPALLALRRSEARLRPFAIAATLLVAVDWLGLAQRPSGAAETAAMTFAAALALAALGAREVAARDLFPAALTILVLGVGVLAAAHPVPMWPDGLSPLWHARPPLGSPAATAADTWRQEQHDAGLAGARPFAAALRLISLAGCAAVWACAARATARASRS